jgi:hypothetical protein
LIDRSTDDEIAAAERLIAGLIGNPTLVSVVVSMGLTDAHFPRGTGLQTSFRFAVAGQDCVREHVASEYEDLSHSVLRRIAKLNVDLTVAEVKALAQHLLDPLAVRIAADRRPREKAKRFLRDVLRPGPMQATAVQRQARAFGISEKTLRRTGKDLGVRIEKTGFQEGWMWTLPEDGHGHSERVQS